MEKNLTLFMLNFWMLNTSVLKIFFISNGDFSTVVLNFFLKNLFSTKWEMKYFLGTPINQSSTVPLVASKSIYDRYSFS